MADLRMKWISGGRKNHVVEFRDVENVPEIL